MKTRKRSGPAPTVLAIQHVRCETPGKIREVVEREGISTKIVRVFEDQKIPSELGDATGLIIMGGPMGVYERDRHPFLRREMRLIEATLKSEKPVLGVCLGSQLLAAALGARVSPGRRKEIGWHPIRLTGDGHSDPLLKGVARSFTAYHWHGDVFELARGAVSLASSRLTRHQAFRYGNNAYGFLFHMEVTQKIMRDMVRIFAGELRAEGLDGAEILRDAKNRLSRLSRIGAEVFRRWAGLVQATEQAETAVSTQRVYDGAKISDSARLLVDRLWPRGLKKETLRGVLWVKEAAPSDPLRRWYGHDPKKWAEFRRRYFAELDGKLEAWEPILETLREASVVLLYSARDTEHNNAVALRDYLLAKVKKK
jgi:GMP synthase (glutamine-hydrolysing)